MDIDKKTQNYYYFKGQSDFISLLKNWQDKIKENQLKIEKEFNFNNIDNLEKEKNVLFNSMLIV